MTKSTYVSPHDRTMLIGIAVLLAISLFLNLVNLYQNQTSIKLGSTIKAEFRPKPNTSSASEPELEIDQDIGHRGVSCGDTIRYCGTADIGNRRCAVYCNTNSYCNTEIDCPQ